MSHSHEKDWEIETELTGGGQSFTYLVSKKGQQDHQKYVLKRNKNKKRELRIRREIDALLQLDHPNIAKIVALDLEDEYPWFIQNYYSGGDLEKYVHEERGISLPEAFDIFSQICEGLWYCHSKGIYHRDVKPANIFIDPENKSIVIGDFGLCWLPSDSPRLTETTERVGSWHFMPPEYRNGRVEDPTDKGDVYSLGKLLYYLLSGGKSFDREEHREKNWDLVHIASAPTPDWPDNLYLEHVNLLLDRMIVQDPEVRSNIEPIFRDLPRIKRLVLEKFNLIEGGKYAPCNYCGRGYYQNRAITEGSFQKFMGFQPSGINTENRFFRALVCDYCGHVQVFYFPDSNIDWMAKK